MSLPFGCQTLFFGCAVYAPGDHPTLGPSHVWRVVVGNRRVVAEFDSQDAAREWVLGC